MSRILTRRAFLASGVAGPALLLSGCDRLGDSPFFRDTVLSTGEWLSYRVQRLLGADALVREFPASAMSPEFRINGNSRPDSANYRRHAAENFVNWRLAVAGRVANPDSYSLLELRKLPSRSQITRHDCVEGWSAIGKWTGVPLSVILDRAKPMPDARYIVFHCADDFNGTRYYESIDFVDAFHPQTILAYGMNDIELPTGHGAPLRLRVERQLGYKHAKFIMRIEVVASLDAIGRGRGGFWEDVGNYEWYAGI